MRTVGPPTRVRVMFETELAAKSMARQKSNGRGEDALSELKEKAAELILINTSSV